MVNADAPKNSIGTQSASYVLISESVLMVNGTTVKIYVICVPKIAFRARVQLRTVLIVRNLIFYKISNLVNLTVRCRIAVKGIKLPIQE
jgi:hypothetical protein